MNPNILIAAISAGGSVVIAVTALLLTFRGFNSIDRQMDAINRRLEVMEQDMKQFYKILSELSTDMARVIDKIGLS